MKTFAKIILNIALVLLVLGVVIGLISVAMGASPLTVGNNFQHGWFANPTNWQVNRTEMTGIPSQEDVIDGAGLRNLNFEIGLGEAIIQRGENFEIIFANEASRSHFYHYRRGDTWHIGTHDHHVRGWGFWRNNRDNLGITIIIPADFAANHIYIALGMGMLRAEQLVATNFDFDIGMGSATIENLSVERLVTTIGMGDLRINNCDAANIFVDVGMGAAYINLTRPVTSYRGQANGGLGSATIGANRFAGVFSSSFGATTAPYYIEINVGMGSVEIR